MMINKNKFHSPLFKEKEDREETIKILNIINKIQKRPVFYFSIFAIVLLLMPTLIKELNGSPLESFLKNSGLGFLSLGKSDVTALGDVMIFCIVALGFCLLLGYSALASLGTAGFIAIGAYSAYYGIVKWGLGIGVSFVLAIVAALAIGVVVGYISLRIEGIYLAIVTLGVAQIIKEILSALMDTIKIKGSDLTLFGMDSLKLKADHVYYIIIAVLFILMLVTSNLMNSPTGRAMLAMKNSTSAAQTFGISLLKYRLMAFMISIVFAAIAGFLFMMYSRFVSNSSSTLFTLSTSLNILGAVIIGGTKSIWGTIGGVFIIYGIDKLFLQDISIIKNGQVYYIFRENPTLITLFCGILVVVVVMFYPGGLAQLAMELTYKAKTLFKKMKEARYGKDLG